MIDKDVIRRDRAALVREIEQAGAQFRGNACKCIFHEDRHPSGGVYCDEMGIWRFHCQAISCGFSGDIFDVQAKLRNTTPAEILKASKPTAAKPPKVYATLDELKAAMPGPVEAVYQYTDPQTGTVDMIVVRYTVGSDKHFRQARPHAGGYIQQAPKKPWPLYNRGRVSKADTVVVVEGEGKVHALQGYGIVGTTSPCGALKGEHTDWTPLAGKNVVLWPDADEPGRKHMAQVEAILQSLEPSPRISLLEPADLDLHGKEDCVDYIKQLEVLHTDKAAIQSAIMEALGKARPRGVASGLNRLIEDTISGKRQAIQWPWSSIGGLTKALLQETVTVICGGVGASKSFMLLQSGAYWHRQGIKTAIYELEESRAFHLSRCLAQLSSCSDMTDPDFIRDNPEQARALFSEHEAFLDSFGACVYASPDTQPTLDQLAKWVQARAKAGCRIVAIDPVTAAAHTSRASWEEDGAFLHTIKRCAVEYGCSIVLVTHPVKAVSFADVTQLSGGAAYSRFAQTILWLESHDDKTSSVRTPCGTTDVEHNRTLHILKARNGKGQGAKLAYSFESESLTLKEIGIILRKQNKP